jgi:chromate reductase, NAD(P)H dehydrogenase (quinone)
MRILAISGSLRSASYNSALVRAAAERAPEGVAIEIYDRLGELPLYDADLDVPNPPEAVQDFRQRVAAADALFFVTPEYNGSVSGVLKNAVDWASTPRHGGAAIWGKTAAVAGVTTGQYGALWAQQDLRRVLGIAGARVIEGELPVAQAQNVFDGAGRLTDPLLGQRLRTHLENLAHESAAVALAA